MIEYRPLKVRFKDLHELDYITDVACGAYHTLFATKHHSVYATGLNNQGQLGIQSDEPKSLTPQQVVELQGRFITQVSAGEGSFALNPTTVPHPCKSVCQSFFGITSAVDCNNRMWVWDSKSQNSQGNLGL